MAKGRRTIQVFFLLTTYFRRYTLKKRYREKVEKLGGLKDPYLLLDQGVVGDPCLNWPEVEYPDIFNFIIESSSGRGKSQGL